MGGSELEKDWGGKQPPTHTHITKVEGGEAKACDCLQKKNTLEWDGLSL